MAKAKKRDGLGVVCAIEDCDKDATRLTGDGPACEEHHHDWLVATTVEVPST